MVKVRFDIVVFMFIWIILVILGNSFVNFEKDFYEDASERSGSVGYPPSDEALVVTTMDELEAAMEEDDEFTIEVDTDKIKKTNYVKQQHTDLAVQKMPGFFVLAFGALEGNVYDRMYIVELENGERVPVLMFGDTLDFSEDTIKLPIGEVKEFNKKKDYLKELDDKYELGGSDVGYWYIDANGDSLTADLDFTNKLDKVECTNWAIIFVGFVIYSIVSTVYMVKARKKYMQQVKAQGQVQK